MRSRRCIVAGIGSRHPRPADAAPIQIGLIDDHVADLDAHPEHDLLGWRKRLVLSVAFLLDRECGRNGGSDVIEVQQHPITQAFGEMAIVIRKNTAPDILDEGQPAGNEL